jgi:gliding motility-associated lipoprotein GldH
MLFGQKLFPIYTALLLFVAIMLTSCGDQYIFEAETDIPNAQWSYRDTLDFKIPVADTAQLYNLYIRFTHADTFPNQNIYLKLYTRFPDGKRVTRIRSFDLFDMQGTPQGKCSGGQCQTQILLQDNLYFNQLGEHLITLEQYSRSSPLNGLIAVGVMMEKTEKKR